MPWPPSPRAHPRSRPWSGARPSAGPGMRHDPEQRRPRRTSPERSPTSPTGGEGPLLEPVEVAHRLWDPVQQYAMIDNALRAADGRTLAEHRAEVADLWARFNRVARTNPDAAFPAPMDARADRYPFAVQPAAGLPLQQVALHPVDGQPGRGPTPLLGRDGRSPRGGRRPVGPSPGRAGVEPRRFPAASPGRPIPGRPWTCSAGAAETRIGRPIADAEIIEVYSCFPAAVRVQQRCLGLDPAPRPPSPAAWRSPAARSTTSSCRPRPR